MKPKRTSTDGTTYLQSGVSIEAGSELVRRIKRIVSSQGSSGIGGFSGLFPLPKKFGNVYLSGCCDGVGTKLKIAFLTNRHDTVGIDLVAMSVNDLVCQGARPLFFLDYFACGKLDVDVAEQVIKGIQNGCRQSGCALLGGETAEMPGFYKEGEYDLAGFALGIVDGKDVVDGSRIRAGDTVIGLHSSGVHSNGFSLVRKIFSEPELRDLGEELLTPTRIYVKEVLSLLGSGRKGVNRPVKGIAHITGGGWFENVPRVLPRGLEVQVRNGSWPVLSIFKRIQEKGQVSREEMFRTFNMGIGMVLIVDSGKVREIRKILKESYVIGKVRKGRSGVVFT